MLGVETALAVVLTTFVEPGVCSLERVLTAMTWRPAAIAGIDALGHGGPIVAGRARAPLCVDPDHQWVVDGHTLASRSRNTPWEGWKLTGKVRHTIFARHPDRPRLRGHSMTTSLLVLADGETFEGEAVGHVPDGGVTAGEVVFNTALAGYQEIVTDPSYAGQIITFTYPHIGNYGINERDDEARRAALPRCHRA